jgi:uncharacterized protein (DUF362 family)
VKKHGFQATREDWRKSLHCIAGHLGWADEQHVFGNIIPSGARVVLKPNLVTHANTGPWGIEPLITSPVLIQAVADEVLSTSASQVLIGDAPLQSCDFQCLLSVTGLDNWSAQLCSRDHRFVGIVDWRRTTCSFDKGTRKAEEGRQPLERFVLFDLGCDSLLEPITDDHNSFRVTCYDPTLLAKRHFRGRHQYLIAKDVLDADVVINLPKLKTHKKAGMTGALKNLVGINGNKEFLPHHRVGGSAMGGDCYPGFSPLKRTLEFVLDCANMARSSSTARWWNTLAMQLQRTSCFLGDRIGVEGSWLGNDTVWRMTLDLNRILLYGRGDGTMADDVQRQVIHIVDAVVAGQGDGPLASQPLQLGLLLAGNNAAVVDWVGAGLLGYDPMRIPIVSGAFDRFRWRLVASEPTDIEIAGDWGAGPLTHLPKSSRSVLHPAGWKNLGA